MSERGRLITLEGVDGAGKSTHLGFIADRLRMQGHDVLTTREPGGTPLAEKLRELVLSEPMDGIVETMIVFAARADHVTHTIRPALDAGTWVLCDRFTDATVAYQGAGKGVPHELIQRLAEAAHPGLRPDRTLVFDCPYEIARKRLDASGRPLDRFETEGRSFFERVRQAYRSRAEMEPGRMRIIDASMSIGQIQKALEDNLIFS